MLSMGLLLLLRSLIVCGFLASIVYPFEAYRWQRYATAAEAEL